MTVLWDWNGTLLNDVAVGVETLNEMLTEHGYAPVDGLDAYRSVFCFPIETYYKNVGFDFSRHPYAQLAEVYMKKYVAHSAGCGLMPDAMETLQALRARGVRQVVLSASHRPVLQAQVERLGVAEYFDALLARDDVYARSKVDVGKAWLTENHIAPEAAVMIGDSVHDFEVAAALGARCILYSGGHQNEQALRAQGVPVIARLQELQSLLDTIEHIEKGHSKWIPL